MEPAHIHHHIEQPASWESLPRCVTVRGWCFAAGGRPVHAVRLRTADRLLPGVVGLPRPDVKAALPAAPDDNTGFEICGLLPGGPIQLCVEVQLAEGTWVALTTRPTRVRRRFRPLWLGGGDWMELMSTQMPMHPAHRPRPVRPERFPPAARGPRPRFAIVTPSFNQARFLRTTLTSVLAQPGVECDYVVQDGGSRDDSAALIRQQADRLHAWCSEPDAGQANAIAKGFAQTSGGPDDLMAWINADDFYLPNALGYVADYFTRHPDVDVIYGHRIVVNEASEEIARWFLPPHDPEVLRLNDFVPQETMFWRRRIWAKVGGIDPAFNFAMDWDLLLRFQAAGARIVRVPCFLSCFRVHPAQKTSAAMPTTGQTEIRRLRERTQ